MPSSEPVPWQQNMIDQALRMEPGSRFIINLPRQHVSTSSFWTTPVNTGSRTLTLDDLFKAFSPQERRAT